MISTLTIFILFARLSLISFGGLMSILPEMEKQLVLENHWFTHQEFMQYYLMAQLAPGPNMVICSLLGFKLHGIPGLIAAFLGVYGPAFFFVALLFFCYNNLRKNEFVRGMEMSLRPTILGITMASLLKIGIDLTLKIPALFHF